MGNKRAPEIANVLKEYAHGGSASLQSDATMRKSESWAIVR